MGDNPLSYTGPSQTVAELTVVPNADCLPPLGLHYVGRGARTTAASDEDTRGRPRRRRTPSSVPGRFEERQGNESGSENEKETEGESEGESGSESEGEGEGGSVAAETGIILGHRPDAAGKSGDGNYGCSPEKRRVRGILVAPKSDRLIHEAERIFPSFRGRGTERDTTIAKIEVVSRREPARTELVVAGPASADWVRVNLLDQQVTAGEMDRTIKTRATCLPGESRRTRTRRKEYHEQVP